MAYKWGMEAFMIAHDRVVNERKDLLIVILKEKIDVEKLPPDLRPYIRKFMLVVFNKSSKCHFVILSTFVSLFLSF